MFPSSLTSRKKDTGMYPGYSAYPANMSCWVWLSGAGIAIWWTIVDITNHDYKNGFYFSPGIWWSLAFVMISVYYVRLYLPHAKLMELMQREVRFKDSTVERTLPDGTRLVLARHQTIYFLTEYQPYNGREVMYWIGANKFHASTLYKGRNEPIPGILLPKEEYYDYSRKTLKRLVSMLETTSAPARAR